MVKTSLRKEREKRRTVWACSKACRSVWYVWIWGVCVFVRVGCGVCVCLGCVYLYGVFGMCGDISVCV